MADAADLNGERSADLTGERDRLRQEVVRLQAEASDLKRALDAAREEVKDKAEVVKERDACLKTLHFLLRKDVTFTAEEIADMEKTGGPIDDIIEEMEQALRSGGR
jgi:uncharacterized coiled-coil DUF342 family protein